MHETWIRACMSKSRFFFSAGVKKEESATHNEKFVYIQRRKKLNQSSVLLHFFLQYRWGLFHFYPMPYPDSSLTSRLDTRKINKHGLQARFSWAIKSDLMYTFNRISKSGIKDFRLCGNTLSNKIGFLRIGCLNYFLLLFSDCTTDLFQFNSCCSCRFQL